MRTLLPITLLAAVCGACAAEPTPLEGADPAMAPTGLQGPALARADASTADASAADTPDSAETPRIHPVVDRIGYTFERWPFEVRASHLDGAAISSGSLYIASRLSAARPTVEPSLIRIAHRRQGDGAVLGSYNAAVAEPSEVAVASSGDRVMAAWHQRVEGGRGLVLHLIDGDPAAGRTTRLPLSLDIESTPARAPMLSGNETGWLLCSAVEGGAPRCVRLDRQGAPRARHWLRRLKSYPMWKLLAADDGGFHLFAADCAMERCRRPRIVMQRLDAEGVPRGPLRTMMRLTARRGLGVFGTPEGPILFGKRVGAKHGTAFIVGDEVVSELSGRWSRTHGGVATAEGAMLLEVATLRMLGAHPTTGWRPMLWDAATGERGQSRVWPAEVEALLPTGMDLRLQVHDGFFVISRLPRQRVIQGVVLRPGVAVESEEDDDPTP